MVKAVREEVSVVILDDRGFDKDHNPYGNGGWTYQSCIIDVRHLASIVACTSEVIDSHGAATLSGSRTVRGGLSDFPFYGAQVCREQCYGCQLFRSQKSSCPQCGLLKNYV